MSGRVDIVHPPHARRLTQHKGGVRAPEYETCAERTNPWLSTPRQEEGTNPQATGLTNGNNFLMTVDARLRSWWHRCAMLRDFADSGGASTPVSCL